LLRLAISGRKFEGSNCSATPPGANTVKDVKAAPKGESPGGISPVEVEKAEHMPPEAERCGRFKSCRGRGKTSKDINDV